MLTLLSFIQWIKNKNEEKKWNFVFKNTSFILLTVIVMYWSNKKVIVHKIIKVTKQDWNVLNFQWSKFESFNANEGFLLSNHQV